MTRGRSQPEQAGSMSGVPMHVNGTERASDAEQRRIDWLLPGAIPAHALVLLEGRKTTGKSSIAAAIAACITGGPKIPGWAGPRQGGVIWCDSENGWASVVVPRLDAAGACLPWVLRPQLRDGDGAPVRLSLPEHLDELRRIISESNSKLLVLDPFVSLVPSTLDVRIEQQARTYLEPLADLCWECECSCIMIRHLRKGTSGDTREHGLGSVAVANIARSVLRCDEHPHEQDRYVLSCVSCNYGRRAMTRIFSLEETSSGYPRVQWLGESSLDADAIAEGRGSEAERDEWHDADLLLFSLIGQRWVRVSDLQTRAEDAGISGRMLRRAKARLGIPSRQRQVGKDHFWEWGPPRRGWPIGIAIADQPEAPQGGDTRARGRVERVPHENLEKPSKRPRRPRGRTRPPLPPTDPPPQEAPDEPSSN